MSGPNVPLHRMRTAALVAAVAALLTSVGATTVARAEAPGAVGTAAAAPLLDPALNWARGWAVVPR
jgi:hypothetical protein